MIRYIMNILFFTLCKWRMVTSEHHGSCSHGTNNDQGFPGDQLGTFIIFTMLSLLALFASAVGESTSRSLRGRFLAGGFPPEGGPTKVLYMSASVGYFFKAGDGVSTLLWVPGCSSPRAPTSPLSSLRPSFPSMDFGLASPPCNVLSSESLETLFTNSRW